MMEAASRTSGQSGNDLATIAEGSRVVCTVTGHGLKDPDVAKDAISGIITAPAEKGAILRLL